MKESVVSMERIESKILLLRGQKIMLDRDLAELYGVPTKALKQAVKRNADRFPEDFMFVLSLEEFTEWRSQFVTSKSDRMGLRYPPMAFTEQGVAMLSSVLNSERAVQVNITIVRAFVRLRQMLSSHADLARKLEELEKKYDGQFRLVFDALRQLTNPPEPKKKEIGFHAREARGRYGRRKRSVSVRAVLSGDEVVVKTREGNLRIIADKPAGLSVLGRCRAMNIQTDDAIDQPTAPIEEWERPE